MVKKANGLEQFGAIYARYSSDKQKEISIEGQVRACRDLAAKMGITIVAEYIDRAITGKTVDRPQFQKMIADSGRGRFGVVLTWKIDRFSRNRYDSAIYKAKLKVNGVKVAYVADTIPDGPEGVIVESMLEGMAEYFSLNLATNVKRGMIELALKGKFTGGLVPLGYKIVDGKYEVDELTAPIVREIFRLRAENTKGKDIIREISERFGKTIQFSTITNITGNKKYIGILEYGEGEDAVSVPGGVPALIEPEMFERVAVLRAAARKTPNLGKGNVKYLLSGKAQCGKCGRSLFGSAKLQNEKLYRYYICSGKYPGRCELLSFRADDLENTVMRAVFNEVLTPEAVDRIARKAVEVQQREADIETGGDEKELRAVQKAIGNLLAAIEAGIFTDTTKARMLALEARQRALLDGLREKENAVPPVLGEKEIRAFLRAFCDGDLDDPVFRQRIVDVFIHKVVLYDDRKAEVFLNVSNSTGDGFVVLTLSVAREGQTKNIEYRRSCPDDKKRNLPK
jgi:site-specific DNA recombinase